MSERAWRVRAAAPQHPHGSFVADEVVKASNPGLAVNRAFGFMRDGILAKKQIHEITFYVSSIPNLNSEAARGAR